MSSITQTSESLTLAGAKVAIAAAEAKARDMGLGMNIAVVDASVCLYSIDPLSLCLSYLFYCSGCLGIFNSIFRLSKPCLDPITCDSEDADELPRPTSFISHACPEPKSQVSTSQSIRPSQLLVTDKEPICTRRPFGAEVPLMGTPFTYFPFS